MIKIWRKFVLFYIFFWIFNNLTIKYAYNQSSFVMRFVYYYLLIFFLMHENLVKCKQFSPLKIFIMNWIDEWKQKRYCFAKPEDIKRKARLYAIKGGGGRGEENTTKWRNKFEWVKNDSLVECIPRRMFSGAKGGWKGSNR